MCLISSVWRIAAMVLRTAKVMFLAIKRLYKAIQTRDRNLWTDCVAKKIPGREIYAPLR